jgi:hypothetical protein
LLASIGHTAGRVKQWAAESREYRRSVDKLSTYRIGQGTCMVIGYYRSSAGEYALTFGGEYTGGVHGQVLEDIYSDQIFLHGNRFFSMNLEDREDKLRLMLSEGRCILLQGSPLPGGRGSLPEYFNATEVARGGDEVLYRLSLALPATSAPAIDGNGK